MQFRAPACSSPSSPRETKAKWSTVVATRALLWTAVHNSRPAIAAKAANSARSHGSAPLRGDVLNERATEGDVHDLNAATDRECGKGPLAGGVNEGGLEGVSPIVHCAEGGVRRNAVAARVDVLSSSEHQARHSSK